MTEFFYNLPGSNRAFPDLLESALVLTYHTPILHSIVRDHSLASEIQYTAKPKFEIMSASSWSLLLTNVLMLVGTQTEEIQRLIVSAINPVVVGAIGFMGTSIGRAQGFSNPLLGVPIIIGSIFSAAIILFFWKRSAHWRKWNAMKQGMIVVPAAGEAGAAVGRRLRSRGTKKRKHRLDFGIPSIEEEKEEELNHEETRFAARVRGQLPTDIETHLDVDYFLKGRFMNDSFCAEEFDDDFDNQMDKFADWSFESSGEDSAAHRSCDGDLDWNFHESHSHNSHSRSCSRSDDDSCGCEEQIEALGQRPLEEEGSDSIYLRREDAGSDEVSFSLYDGNSLYESSLDDCDSLNSSMFHASFDDIGDGGGGSGGGNCGDSEDGHQAIKSDLYDMPSKSTFSSPHPIGVSTSNIVSAAPTSSREAISRSRRQSPGKSPLSSARDTKQSIGNGTDPTARQQISYVRAGTQAKSSTTRSVVQRSAGGQSGRSLTTAGSKVKTKTTNSFAQLLAKLSKPDIEQISSPSTLMHG